MTIRTSTKRTKNTSKITDLRGGLKTADHCEAVYVEPAVNRQPGFRRGAVEQSAFNNTHTSKNNLYVLFFRTDGRDGQTGGRMHG